MPFIFINQTIAFDTSVKGFIALDLANIEKIEGKKLDPQVGIGVLDLKVFAEQDGLTFNMKLDLDGKLAEANNIFEEAYVGYRGIRDWRFNAGKGVIKFQNIHWGVAENSYQDGGSIISTENSWRKLSRRAFVSTSYGHKNVGFLNTTSIFGDSSEIKTNDDGNPTYDTTCTNTNGCSPTYVKGYTYEQVKAFNINKQIGLANKFEYFFDKDITLTQGLVANRNKFTDKTSWAATVSFRYETEPLEVWSEIIYGYTSTAPYEKYATYAKTETFAQLGMEYALTPDWSYLANAEFLIVDDQAHTYRDFVIGSKTFKKDSYTIKKDGSRYKSQQGKFETGVKYKLNKSAHITFAGIAERKEVEKDGVKDLKRIDGVYDPNRSAYKFITSLSYWF